VLGKLGNMELDQVHVSVAPRCCNLAERSDGRKVVCGFLLRRRQRNVRRMPSNRRKMKAPKTPPTIVDVGAVLVDVLAKPLLLDIGKKVEDPETVEKTWTV